MMKTSRILFVEDDPQNVLLFQRLLQTVSGLGLEMDHATTLVAGLQKLSNHSFDLVLLDLDLPDSTGLPTFLQTHDHFPEIPIIVLTGHSSETVALEAISRGAQDYLIIDGITSENLARSIRYGLERHDRFAELNAQCASALRALDQLTCGVILIGRNGKILIMNRAAKAIAADQDGLIVDRDLIHTNDNDETNSLRALINRILNPVRTAVRSRGGYLKLTRKRSSSPLVLLITSLISERHRHQLEDAALAIFVSDPERGSISVEDVLRRRYMLTAAEARLCTVILQGKTVEDCSNVLKVTVHTVRSHLKKIFQKNRNYSPIGPRATTPHRPARFRIRINILRIIEDVTHLGDATIYISC